jgi:hypothetical protein
MASVSYFWKREDGRWRLAVVLLIVFFLSDAVYDFVKEGWRLVVRR